MLNNERFQIYEMLRAYAPHPEYQEKLMLFGQFVGTWDMKVRFCDENGIIIYDHPGTWAFSWVLDGRAIQDVLIYPNPEKELSNAPGNRRIGSTLRYYDLGLDIWRVIWLGVVSGDLGVMTGRKIGDEIWIEEKEADESLTRWIFTDITRDSFHWKGTVSQDQGRSWKMEQEMFAVRHSSK